MAYYKITNITETLSKRDVHFNKTLKIEYIDRMMKRFNELKPGEHMFFKSDKLPVGIHKMRLDGHIIVSDIGEKFFHAGYQKELEIKEQQNKEKQSKQTKNTSKVQSKTPTVKQAPPRKVNIGKKGKQKQDDNNDTVIETQNLENKE